MSDEPWKFFAYTDYIHHKSHKFPSSCKGRQAEQAPQSETKKVIPQVYDSSNCINTT